MSSEYWYTIKDESKFRDWLDAVDDLEWEVAEVCRKQLGMERVLRYVGDYTLSVFVNRNDGNTVSWLFSYKIPRLDDFEGAVDQKIEIKPNFDTLVFKDVQNKTNHIHGLLVKAWVHHKQGEK